MYHHLTKQRVQIYDNRLCDKDRKPEQYLSSQIPLSSHEK